MINPCYNIEKQTTECQTLHQSYLGVIESVDELLIIEDVSLGLEQQFEDPVLDGLELVLVCVDLQDELVPLLLQLRPLQTHHFTGTRENGGLKHWFTVYMSTTAAPDSPLHWNPRRRGSQTLAYSLHVNRYEEPAHKELPVMKNGFSVLDLY